MKDYVKDQYNVIMEKYSDKSLTFGCIVDTKGITWKNCRVLECGVTASNNYCGGGGGGGGGEVNTGKKKWGDIRIQYLPTGMCESWYTMDNIEKVIGHPMTLARALWACKPLPENKIIQICKQWDLNKGDSLEFQNDELIREIYNFAIMKI